MPDGVGSVGTNSPTEAQTEELVEGQIDKATADTTDELSATDFSSTVRDMKLQMKAQKFANLMSLTVNLHSMIENMIAKIFQKLNNPG